MNLRLFALVLLTGSIAGCGNRPDAVTRQLNPSENVVVVYTVSYPLAFFAEYLGNGAVDVVFPIPAGVDPAYWEPDVATVLDYQQADLVLLNGAGYAKWLDKVSLPRRSLFNSAAGYVDEFIEVNVEPIHSHGPQGEHSHGEFAFTTWLDLSLAQLQLASVAAELSSRLPAHATRIETRGNRLAGELAALDARLLAVGETLDAAPVVFSHPVYQYLERRYRLNGRSVHWEPGEAPDAAQWSDFDKLLEAHPARLMIWEAQPLAQTRAALEKRGIEVIVYNTLSSRPAAGDFLQSMTNNVDALAAAASGVGN